MRCRGWGQNLNLVRTERLIDLKKSGFSVCYRGPEAIPEMALKFEEDVDEEKPRTLIKFVGTLAEFRELILAGVNLLREIDKG